MKKFFKWFNLSKFYALNIFLWLNIFTTLVGYCLFIYIFFFENTHGIDKVISINILEAEIFIAIAVSFLFLLLFIIELILRKINIIKTCNILVLNKYLRIILSIISLICIFFNYLLLESTYHLVEYLYFDNY